MIGILVKMLLFLSTTCEGAQIGTPPSYIERDGLERLAPGAYLLIRISDLDHKACCGKLLAYTKSVNASLVEVPTTSDRYAELGAPLKLSRGIRPDGPHKNPIAALPS